MKSILEPPEGTFADSSDRNRHARLFLLHALEFLAHDSRDSVCGLADLQRKPATARE
jgi:hypothetical protein